MSSTAAETVTVLESPFELRIAVFCTMAATFMQALDQTIANVALPHMQGSLQASRDEITWVLTSYIVASAIMTPPIGWLASRLGRKNLFLWSIIGFTVTSALCGAAQSLEEMILFRLLQGVFGASISPLSQSLIIDRFTLQKRAQLFGLWAMVVTLGPILGPTLGGWLTDAYSWRWVFYINVPVGVLVAVGIFVALKEAPGAKGQKFDGFGFVMVSIALMSLQLVLDRGTGRSWFESTEIVLEAAIGVLAIYLFVVHLWTARSTLFPTDLLDDRNFVSGVTLTLLLGGLIISTAALLPPYLQTLGGYSVLSAGLLLAPRGIGTMIAMQITSRLVLKSDPRHLIVGGSVLTIWSMWEMAKWTPAIDGVTVALVSTIQGLGIGFMFMPCSFLTFSTLAPHLRTDGASWFALSRSMGAALGVSFTSAVVSTYIQVAHSEMAANVTPFNRALSANGAGMMWNPSLPFGVEALEGVVSHEAAIIAYSDAFLLMFYLSLLTPLFVLFMRKPDPAGSAPSESVAME